MAKLPPFEASTIPAGVVVGSVVAFANASTPTPPAKLPLAARYRFCRFACVSQQSVLFEIETRMHRFRSYPPTVCVSLCIMIAGPLFPGTRYDLNPARFKPLRDLLVMSSGVS